MMHPNKVAVVILLGWLATGPILAQEPDGRENRAPRAGGSSSGAQTNRAEHRDESIAAGDLFGATIRLRDDAAFGTVDELYFDTTGSILLIGTQHDGVFVPIPFEAVSLSRLSDGYVYADVDRDTVLDAPVGKRLSSFAESKEQARVQEYYERRVGRMRRDELASKNPLANRLQQFTRELDAAGEGQRSAGGRQVDRVDPPDFRPFDSERTDSESIRSAYDRDVSSERRGRLDRGLDSSQRPFDTRSRGVDLDRLRRDSDSLRPPRLSGSDNRPTFGNPARSSSGSLSPSGSPGSGLGGGNTGSGTNNSGGGRP